MDKYLVTIEFRYSDAPANDSEFASTAKSTTVTIGVFDSLDVACVEGNKQLVVLESKFKLNPHYNRRERFTPSMRLITDLGYLQTPFSFFAKIDTMRYTEISDVVDSLLSSVKRYAQYKKNMADE